MNKFAGFILRKVIYVGLATGTAAAAAYLAGHHDIGEWTIKGIGIAAGTAAWGAILSNAFGGSLSSK